MTDLTAPEPGTADATPVVRRAAPADAPVLARIRVASWRATYAGIVPAEVLAGLRPEPIEARMSHRISEPGELGMLVVEAPGEGVVGYASVGPSRDDLAPGVGEVYAIYLAPGALGRGLGRALMERALADLVAAGYHAAVLWVLTANHPARRFYEHEGFALDGAVKMADFDGALTEEVRYRRSLPPVAPVTNSGPRVPSQP